MRETKPRKVGSRAPRNIVLVVVEGDTERNYFDHLKERDTNLRIVTIKPGPADPLHLIEACLNHMNYWEINVEEGDIAICVFDVDENPPDRMVRAMEVAMEHGILISLTNPCFELWLALHFQDVRGPLSRKEAHSLLKGNYPRYTKTCELGPLFALREEAIRRARFILDRAGAASPADLIEINPSSNIHLALGSIEALKERNRRGRTGHR